MTRPSAKAPLCTDCERPVTGSSFDWLDAKGALCGAHLSGVTERLVLECRDLQLARFRAELEALHGRRRESRQLLRRFVKYVREDRAVTPGKTRLERLTAQVEDYLNRTSYPRDILRRETESASPTGEKDG